MKKQIILIITLMFFITIPSMAVKAEEAKKVLSITELDPDGKKFPVNDGKSVDVNSILLIHIDTDAIRGQASLSGSGSEARYLVENIDRLGKAIVNAQESIPPLIKATAAYNVAADKKKDSNESKALRNARQDAADSLFEVIKIVKSMSEKGDTRLRNSINLTLDKNYSSLDEQYFAVLNATREGVKILRNDLTTALTKEGLTIQVGGWVSTPQGQLPLHLPGFDDLAEQPRNELDRVHLMLSESDSVKLQAYGKLANDINNGVVIKNLANELFSSVIENLMAQLKSLKGKLDAFDSSVESEDVKAKLNDVKRAIFDLQSQIIYLQTKYRQEQPVSATDFLTGTNQDLNKLIELINKTGVCFAAATPAIENYLKTANELIKKTGNDFIDILKQTKYGLENNWNSALAQLGKDLEGLFYSGQAVFETQDFANEVYRLSLNNIPSDSRLPLVTSGRHGAGDTVLLRVQISQVGKSPQTVDEFTVRLQRIVSYITTVPGLILAAVPDSSPLSFQAAPAYSILLKKGSRQNPFINTILTPGFGLNVSALDFNHDNTPELGLGLTVSLFRDVLNIGYGYNLYRGNAYSFIGLNLPVSILGFPSTASVNSQ